MKLRMLLLAAVCAALLETIAAAAASVKVEGGLVEGTVENGLAVYRGIPFAAPPVGDLRWRAPQPAAKWQGVLRADKFAARCMQGVGAVSPGAGQAPEMSEDCLYLNVWSPAKSAGDRVPVLVWIYGGGFGGGATSIPTYSGEQLAKKGVVLVSIAYRVGPLGFLAHPELSAETKERVSGNYGQLKPPATAGDQMISDAMATYWTDFAKRGDPNGSGVPKWPAFSDANPVVMVLCQPPHTGPVPSEEGLKGLDAYFAWRRTPEGEAAVRQEALASAGTSEMGIAQSTEGMPAPSNIVPFIESNYRVLANAENRALAGLSMGGGQAFFVGLGNKDRFGSIGVFSTGLFGGIGAPGGRSGGASGTFNAEEQIPGILTNAKSFNNSLKVFYISVGEQDPRLEPTKKAVADFKSHGLNAEFTSFPGGHEWQVWRKSLHDFVQRIFRQ